MSNWWSRDIQTLGNLIAPFQKFEDSRNLHLNLSYYLFSSDSCSRRQLNFESAKVFKWIFMITYLRIAFDLKPFNVRKWNFFVLLCFKCYKASLQESEKVNVSCHMSYQNKAKFSFHVVCKCYHVKQPFVFLFSKQFVNKFIVSKLTSQFATPLYKLEFISVKSMIRNFH